MNINVTPSVIAVTLSVLLGYAVYSIAGNDDNANMAFVGAAISFVICSFLGFGVSYKDSRKKVSLRILSCMFFFAMAVSQFSFALIGINRSAYIVVNGIILLMFLLAFYSVYKSRQQ